MKKEPTQIEMRVEGQEYASKPYHYRACGLDDVYLLNGFEHRETAYGRGVAIHDVEGLHKAIADCLLERSQPLSAKEFRFLRKRLDMTQEVLATKLQVDVQTVARYEKGQTTPIPQPTEVLFRILCVIFSLPEESRLNVVRMLKREFEKLNVPQQERIPESHMNFMHGSDGWNAGGAALTH